MWWRWVRGGVVLPNLAGGRAGWPRRLADIVLAGLLLLPALLLIVPGRTVGLIAGYLTHAEPLHETS